VSDTVADWMSVPAVPATVIAYVPAGVPADALTPVPVSDTV
jgi:hypothetical protein